MLFAPPKRWRFVTRRVHICTYPSSFGLRFQEARVQGNPLYGVALAHRLRGEHFVAAPAIKAPGDAHHPALKNLFGYTKYCFNTLPSSLDGIADP